VKTSDIVLLGLGVAAFTAAPLASQAEECEGAPSANKLSILIEGVRSSRGQMTASLYPDDKTKFLAESLACSGGSAGDKDVHLAQRAWNLWRRRLS